ncbi:protein translocase subunit SecD [Patescibacteria group bacterium]
MKLLNPRNVFWLILILVFFSIYLDLPKDYQLKLNFGNFNIDQKISSPQIDLNFGAFKFKRDLDIKRGLDLQGGTHLVLDADMKDVAEGEKNNSLEGAKNVVQRRVDLYGVSEPVIQTIKSEGNYRLIVELPGAQDINEAIDLIGKTAQLDFRELNEDKKASPEGVLILDYQKTGLTGGQLKNADVQFNQQTGEPMVGLHFNDEGASLFSDITSRNVGFQVAIFLDEIPLTAPRVNEAITSGDAVISGSFTVDEAKKLAIQLNAGALPVPLKVVEQRTIGATLGEESVSKSVKAGLIGLLIVILFMILSYGFLGFLASVALVIYGLLTLSLYKIIPVTLTLPGMAGFLLSVGMAVDSNILIFERIKEERWMGKPASVAMELGFGRAWDSIKDANITTLITCFVLFNPFNWGFLNTSGMVRGFALTLALGIGISLFTGIVVTRTLIRVFYHPKETKAEEEK